MSVLKSQVILPNGAGARELETYMVGILGLHSASGDCPRPRCACSWSHCGVLGGDHHLVAVVALLHPRPDPQLRLFKLVVIECVDEVSSLLEEAVEDLLARLLVTGAH